MASSTADSAALAALACDDGRADAAAGAGASSRRPAPAEPAPLGRRLGALLLDAAGMAALSLPLMWLAYREPVARLDDLRPLSLAINWLLPALLCVAAWTWQGATPGQLLMGLHVVDARSGGRPGPLQSLLRWLACLVSALPLGLGFFWAAFDADRQAWHDRLSRTRVVRCRRGDGDSDDATAGDGYLARHWRGEQSLAQSFWVNNVLLSLPLGLALGGLTSWITLKGEALQASAVAVLLAWPLTLAVDAWCLAGAWRAAAAYLRGGGSALWGWLARLVLALGLLHTLASTVVLLTQAGDYWKLARGVDPIGQARFTLAADGRSVRLSGPIGAGDAARLKALLDGAPQVRLVELASPGGRLFEAERMVGLVRGRGASTRAVGGCESACTVVFLAGAERRLMPGARLGFHRASSGSYNPVFDEVANRHLSAVYHVVGLPDDFIERTLRTPARGMWYPGDDELVSRALVLAPPRTLDVALPARQEAALAELAEALRAHPAWYQLDARFPGLIERAAERMLEARRAEAPVEAQQTAALRELARHVPALIAASDPPLRQRYLALLKAQLIAARDSGGLAACQALLAGALDERRRLPPELLARENAWLIAAAQAPEPRRPPAAVPSRVELEVMRRSVGAHVVGLLGGTWADGADGPARASCEQALRALDATAGLPPATRELAQRLALQR